MPHVPQAKAGRQGGATSITNSSANRNSVTTAFNAPTVLPQAFFRFTKWYTIEQEGHHFHGSYYSTQPIGFQSCEFYGGGWLDDFPPVNANNCLFHRVQVYFADDYTGDQLAFYNNLFRGGQCTFDNMNGYSWVFRDNVFDTTPISSSFGWPTTYDHNGYVNATSINSTNYIGNALQAGDISIANLAWQSGSWGDFYQPTNSAFIDKGSRTAALAGLYQYTTLTNQTKEASSQVDLGYHYVTVDGNGNPLDTDGDGIPDYLEDANGNGTVDSGETDWQNASDLGLKVLITRPRNGSTIP